MCTDYSTGIESTNENLLFRCEQIRESEAAAELSEFADKSNCDTVIGIASKKVSPVKGPWLYAVRRQ